MARIDRIQSERSVQAMVALDTIDMLARRITNLLELGRRMALARRYTYLNDPPELTMGLTLYEVNGPHRDDSGAWFGVKLDPGVMNGFGFSAYSFDGNATEAEAWTRYHEAEHTHPDHFKRRRDMTWIRIKGGLDGDGPARDDSLTIRHGNRDGVCEEIVVGFDYGPDADREN